MNTYIPNENNLVGRNPITLYYCGHEQCYPSHFFGPAIRPHYLFHYILRGKGTYHVNGCTYHLKEGDGFLITPGITTLYCADNADPWEYCWIGFDGYDVKSILENCGLTETKLIFYGSSNQLLIDSFFTLIHNFLEGKGNEYTYVGLLYSCFSHMYCSEENKALLIQESYMAKALDFIHHNYTYDIKIGDLANYLSIDRTYLYKLFILYRKISPQQYLISYRLTIAGTMLRETALNVTEIALSCGFKDASLFNKHFKKHYHIPPLKFRSNTDQVLDLK